MSEQYQKSGWFTNLISRRPIAASLIGGVVVCLLSWLAHEVIQNQTRSGQAAATTDTTVSGAVVEKYQNQTPVVTEANQLIQGAGQPSETDQINRPDRLVIDKAPVTDQVRSVPEVVEDSRLLSFSVQQPLPPDQLAGILLGLTVYLSPDIDQGPQAAGDILLAADEAVNLGQFYLIGYLFGDQFSDDSPGEDSVRIARLGAGWTPTTVAYRQLPPARQVDVCFSTAGDGRINVRIDFSNRSRCLTDLYRVSPINHAINDDGFRPPIDLDRLHVGIFQVLGFGAWSKIRFRLPVIGQAEVHYSVGLNSYRQAIETGQDWIHDYAQAPSDIHLIRLCVGLETADPADPVLEPILRVSQGNCG